MPKSAILKPIYMWKICYLPAVVVSSTGSSPAVESGRIIRRIWYKNLQIVDVFMQVQTLQASFVWISWSWIPGVFVGWEIHHFEWASQHDCGVLHGYSCFDTVLVQSNSSSIPLTLAGETPRFSATHCTEYSAFHWQTIHHLRSLL